MGRILGIDYGDSRIGLALSDPTKVIASPFQTLYNTGLSTLIKELEDLIIEKDIECFVIGLPIGLDGNDTKQTKKVRDFGAAIKEAVNIPIHFQDERLSSQSASRSLVEQNIKTGHNKKMIDQRAAAIFLQQFLDINYNK